jgi:two-component system chemotaxis sensor kinase CheA
MTDFDSSAAANIDDDDSFAIDGPADIVKIPVGMILEKPFATALLQKSAAEGGTIEPIFSKHSDANWQSWAKDVSIVVVECRMLEAFEDFGIIRDIRRERALVPIIAVSENGDPDFVLEALKAGANDWFGPETTPDIVNAKIASLNKLAASARLIEIQNDELVTTMRAQREADERRMKAEAERTIAEAQAAANRQTREILDNLSEGFFMVDQDLKIGPATSASCLKLFGQEIASKPLGSALSLEGDAEKYITVGMMQVFENFMPVDVTVGLLPTRVRTLSGRILEIRYNVVPDATGAPVRLIIGATDITDTLKEREKLEAENGLNKALVEILKDKSSFLDFVHDYRKDVANLSKLDSAATGLRILHTLKGNSAAFGLNDIAQVIHHLETELKDLGEIEQIRFIESRINEISDLLEGFLQRFDAVLQLPSAAVDGESFQISGGILAELTRLAEKMDYQTALRVRSIAKIAKLKPAGNLVAPFKPTVERLADRQNKKIKFEISGGDVRVDSGRFAPLLRSLIHSVRNSCDHGIEETERRIDSGKSEHGTVKIKFENVEDQFLRITITDDGRGIDKDRVLEKAVKVGLVTEQRATSMANKEWLNLIFAAGFSTASEVTDVSGRGVGMDCIKAEVERLGGTISIASAQGVGTKVVIETPL